MTIGGAAKPPRIRRGFYIPVILATAGMTIKKITKKLDIRVFLCIMAFVGGRGHWHNTRGKDMTQTNQTNLTANAVAVESAIGNRQSAIGNRQSAIGIRQSAIGNRIGNRQSAIGNRQFCNRQSAISCLRCILAYRRGLVDNRSRRFLGAIRCNSAFKLDFRVCMPAFFHWFAYRRV